MTPDDWTHLGMFIGGFISVLGAQEGLARWKAKRNGNGAGTALRQMDSEWRKGVDVQLKELARDLYASDGHIHRRIHELDTDLRLELQKILGKLEDVRLDIVRLQVVVQKQDE